MTLTEFLLARIAEDEAIVAYPAEHERAGGYSYADVGGLSDVLTVGTDRVLAECAAKRAIIGSRQSCAAMTEKEQEPGAKLVGAGMVQGLDVALKSLAAVYSDHPDYNSDWAL